jgi:hypothetical protein
MIKMIQLVYKKPEVTQEEFNKNWIEVHGPWAAKNLIVDKYVQNHIVTLPGGFPAEANLILPSGVVEYYFYDPEVERSIRATGRLPTNTATGIPQPKSIANDQTSHVDRSKGMHLWVEEHVIKEYKI